MSIIQPKNPGSKKVHILCDICGGFDHEVFGSHDFANISGDVIELKITSIKTKEALNICTDCAINGLKKLFNLKQNANQQ